MYHVSLYHCIIVSLYHVLLYLTGEDLFGDDDSDNDDDLFGEIEVHHSDGEEHHEITLNHNDDGEDDDDDLFGGADNKSIEEIETLKDPQQIAELKEQVETGIMDAETYKEKVTALPNVGAEGTAPANEIALLEAKKDPEKVAELKESLKLGVLNEETYKQITITVTVIVIQIKTACHFLVRSIIIFIVVQINTSSSSSSSFALFLCFFFFVLNIWQCFELCFICFFVQDT